MYKSIYYYRVFVVVDDISGTNIVNYLVNSFAINPQDIRNCAKYKVTQLSD